MQSQFNLKYCLYFAWLLLFFFVAAACWCTVIRNWKQAKCDLNVCICAIVYRTQTHTKRETLAVPANPKHAARIVNHSLKQK